MFMLAVSVQSLVPITLINRRRFIQTLAAIAATRPGIANARSRGFGELVADSAHIIDLPPGFNYRVIARTGDEMSDGLLVPAEADGMAAFAGDNGFVNLVCNHENSLTDQARGPFGEMLERMDCIEPQRIYDKGGSRSPGTGGTTTLIYDPVARKTERQFLSLAGTELNCAGGPTPWGSWLSCEETFSDPGPATVWGTPVERDQRHGYIFEVPANRSTCTEPRPLKDMGRFEHEAAAVDPSSGVVYLTEDRHRGLLYRFLPLKPGELHFGGQLQAMAIAGQDGFDTRNWNSRARMTRGQWMDIRWIDMQEADSTRNDLRFRGHEEGAALFARGEGACFSEGSLFITCTIGGPDRLGQIFEYRVSSVEGSTGELSRPGQLRLIAESTQDSILRHADNIVVSPWGDLIICEDTANHCGLVGIKAGGTHYYLADNAYSDSELAGICFAPDGKTMFVNIQKQGLTLAINGPW